MEDLFGIQNHLQGVAENIQKALGAGYEPEGTDENVEVQKARSGVYEDNAKNRRLNRVGQQYGKKKEEEQPKDKTSSKKEDEQSDKKGASEKQDMSSHAAKASDGALKRAAADEKAPEDVRNAAKEELKKRGGKSEDKGDKGKKVDLNKEFIKPVTSFKPIHEFDESYSWGLMDEIVESWAGKTQDGKNVFIEKKKSDNLWYVSDSSSLYSEKLNDKGFETPEEAYSEYIELSKEEKRKKEEKEEAKERKRKKEGKLDEDWDKDFGSLDGFSYNLADDDNEDWGDTGPSDKDVLENMLGSDEFDFITEYINKFGEKKTIEKLVKNNETVSPRFAKKIVKTYKGR